MHLQQSINVCAETFEEPGSSTVSCRKSLMLALALKRTRPNFIFGLILTAQALSYGGTGFTFNHDIDVCLFVQQNSKLNISVTCRLNHCGLHRLGGLH